MIKKVILSLAVCFSLALFQNSTFAQEVKDQETLLAELDSEEAEERQAEIEGLERPKDCGVSSIDNLTEKTTALVLSTQEIKVRIPEIVANMTSEVADSLDNAKLQKPSNDELVELSEEITSKLEEVTEATAEIAEATDELQKISPLKAAKALKSLNYSKKAIALVAPELKMNLEVVNGLIESSKATVGL